MRTNLGDLCRDLLGPIAARICGSLTFGNDEIQPSLGEDVRIVQNT